MTEPPPERTALYRLYDAAGALLYVGISANPEQRWQGHAYSVRSHWWPQVHRKAVEWHATREAADEAETAAIRSERPLHNRAKRSDNARPIRWRRLSPEIDWTDRARNPWSDQVAAILRAEMAQGIISPGDPIPTAKQLCERFGVSEQTCGIVLRRIADEGLIHQPRRRSRFFCSTPASPEVSAHAPLLPARRASDRPEYKVFRFAVNRPAEAASFIRAAMTDEQWAAFVAVVAGAGEEFLERP